jgi:hypothetical protein
VPLGFEQVVVVAVCWMGRGLFGGGERAVLLLPGSPSPRASSYCHKLYISSQRLFLLPGTSPPAPELHLIALASLSSLEKILTRLVPNLALQRLPLRLQRHSRAVRPHSLLADTNEPGEQVGVQYDVAGTVC